MYHHTKVAEDYQKKDFSSCLSLIEKAPRGTRETTHYKIIKASCLVNLGVKIDEAHKLLDGIIAKDANNAFACYGKGLALLHQKKFEEAIEFFDKALQHDKTGSMQKATELKNEAIKMMTNDGVGDGNKENIESDAKKEEKQTKSVITKLTTTVTEAATPAKVMEVAKVQEETKPKTCLVCSKTFSKTFSFNRHMASHTGNRPFKCSYCQHGFIQKSDLSRHEAVHKNEVNFKCSTCSKEFNTKKNLQSHQIVHTTDRPFKCLKCPMTFKLVKALKIHQTLHQPEEDKPYKCDTCGKSFQSKPSINSHIETHLNSKLFACNLCKFTYSTVARFGHHFREFHVTGKGNV